MNLRRFLRRRDLVAYGYAAAALAAATLAAAALAAAALAATALAAADAQPRRKASPSPNHECAKPLQKPIHSLRQRKYLHRNLLYQGSVTWLEKDLRCGMVHNFPC